MVSNGHGHGRHCIYHPASSAHENDDVLIIMLLLLSLLQHKPLARMAWDVFSTNACQTNSSKATMTMWYATRHRLFAFSRNVRIYVCVIALAPIIWCVPAPVSISSRAVASQPSVATWSTKSRCAI